MNFKA